VCRLDRISTVFKKNKKIDRVDFRRPEQPRGKGERRPRRLPRALNVEKFFHAKNIGRPYFQITLKENEVAN